MFFVAVLKKVQFFFCKKWPSNVSKKLRNQLQAVIELERVKIKLKVLKIENTFAFSFLYTGYWCEKIWAK